VVNAVSKDANGIGYGGEAYSKGVKVVKLVADGKPAIAPSAETVLNGTYPLARYLYLYLRQDPTGVIKQYVDWILGPEGQQTVKEIGYYPIKPTT
jgi:phosphate transport system substrate-binding protein